MVRAAKIGHEGLLQFLVPKYGSRHVFAPYAKKAYQIAIQNGHDGAAQIILTQTTHDVKAAVSWWSGRDGKYFSRDGESY